MDNKLIFFVDDDKMMLNLMEYTFKCREGFEVRSFFSGEECLDHIFMKPNLIVLDYYLGEGETNGMSGLDTLKRINEINNNIPVVILSREKDKSLIDKFMQDGAMQYVIKDDFFINTLIETVENYFMEKLD
ncbi:MAG: response regulator [Alphaproteobacteria bacterium]|nr:MAG: response regulator [Alphaproteobacteria bacterium]